MEFPNHMPTLSRVLNRLQEKGLANDMRWTAAGFTINGNDNTTYQPAELSIIKIYRFEELKDPGDQCVLYLIAAGDAPVGYILDAYGVYSCHDEEGFDNALRLIPERSATAQWLFEL